MPLTEQLDATAYHSLNLVRSGQEWQANLQVERGGGWRVCHGATPSEALGALFEPVPVFEEPSASSLPPLPY